MNKKYISPEMKIINIDSNTTLLSGSVEGSISGETTPKAYSRRGNFFDDEEFDDEEEEY